jgi:pseudaminic acid biosynthesis-associated methylase
MIHFFLHILEELKLNSGRKLQMSTPQENFWKSTITESYAQDNSIFDEALGLLAWEKILARVEKSDISSYLDCGSNIGRNVGFLQKILPSSSANIIELARAPYEKCLAEFKINQSFLGPIKNATFDTQFDLVFSSGVLIHVNPDDLINSMERMFRLSSRYILIAEYFNRTPVMINYHGEDDRLFKRDFGKLFVQNFDCQVIDYGFLWGYEFDNAGFDDITYWVFEK